MLRNFWKIMVMGAFLLISSGWAVAENLEPPDQELYNNGSFITSFGDGPGGSDVSLLQDISLGFEAFGFGVFKSGEEDSRVADDFTVDSATGWTINKVVFFAYQTESGTDSTITGVNFRIWDGRPGDSSSNIIFGDTTTNRLIETSWTGAYRYSERIVDDTTRPVMNLVGQAGVALMPGTYWIDWQIEGSLSSGSWQPPITIIGEKITGNARQLRSESWGPLVDTGTGTLQGAPFLLQGYVTPEWLVTPTANSGGRIEPDTPQSVKQGDTATFTITPDLGYTASVGGTCGGTLVGETYTTDPITNDCTVEASFSLNTYTVSLTSNPSNGGNVTGSGSYIHGDRVIVKAEPDDNFTFVKWIEGKRVLSCSPQYTFRATGDRNIEAYFSPSWNGLVYNILTSPKPANGGQVTGSGSYNHGTGVSITADTEPGYAFTNWTEAWAGFQGSCVVSKEQEYFFIAVRDRDLTANIRPKALPGVHMLLLEDDN